MVGGGGVLERGTYNRSERRVEGKLKEGVVRCVMWCDVLCGVVRCVVVVWCSVVWCCVMCCVV